MNPGKSSNPRHNNTVKNHQKGSQRQSGFNDNRQKNHIKNTRNHIVPPEVWNTLNQDQKDAILASRRNNKGNNHKKGNNQWRGQKPTSQNDHSESQNGRKVNSTTTHKEEEPEEQDPDTNRVESPTIVRPTINSIMTSRNINVTRIVKINQAVVLPDGDGLIDGGADTCMIGPEFHFESESTTRSVDVEGFEGPEKIVKNLPIGTGVTAVDLPNETILLRVNEGIINKKKTIFSTNQL